MNKNFILTSDAYKYTHHLQYPEGTTHVYSYLESRGSETDDNLLFFGLQYYLKEHLEGQRVSQADVDEAAEFMQGVFGTDTYFNREGWQRIVDVHGGRIPVRIRAVQEGTWVPTSNVLMTIENTDPELPWITNFIETVFMRMWYPISVATYSGSIHSMLTRFATLTGGNATPFHLNDFGARGVSSEESAGIGGMAHLVSFMGSDTVVGSRFAQHYYNADNNVAMSVLASEHSTTTSHLEENECAAFEQFIDAAGDAGIVSIVIDSYDAWRAVDQYIGIDLHDKIMSRSGRVVVRPDSGDPLEQVEYILESLGRNFGYEINDAGYKVLPPQIGIIYGDFMSYDMIKRISEMMEENGWAVDGQNVVFGMGGNLLQNVNRDTHQFAFKCSATVRNNDGVYIDVFKKPATMASKNSKRGRFSLVMEDGVPMTFPYAESYGASDMLQDVFLDGEILREQDFNDIRALSSLVLPERQPLTIEAS